MGVFEILCVLCVSILTSFYGTRTNKKYLSVFDVSTLSTIIDSLLNAKIKHNRVLKHILPTVKNDRWETNENKY